MDSGDGRVVSNFVVQALRGEPLTIYGDGLQTRSFCYVSDLVDGIYKLFCQFESPETPINLGNPREFTMLQLAQLVIKLTGSKSPIQFLELPIDDPKQRKPDISLAKSLLNWTPSIDLETGLINTIEYFKNISL
jgi:UDP-glucuronate decarboxylase